MFGVRQQVQVTFLSRFHTGLAALFFKLSRSEIHVLERCFVVVPSEGFPSMIWGSGSWTLVCVALRLLVVSSWPRCGLRRLPVRLCTLVFPCWSPFASPTMQLPLESPKHLLVTQLPGIMPDVFKPLPVATLHFGVSCGCLVVWPSMQLPLEQLRKVLPKAFDVSQNTIFRDTVGILENSAPKPLLCP